MKGKAIIAMVGLLLLGGAILFAAPPAWLYPDLPFAATSKQTVVAALQVSDDRMTKLASDTSYVWYGTKAAQGREIASLKSMLQAAGWIFLTQEGSGYFFIKGDEKIVITSRQWSRAFVLFKVPVASGPFPLSLGFTC